MGNTIITGQVTLVSSTHQAKKVILSRGNVPAAQNIAFTAGNSIVLLPGFETQSGAAFSARIQACLQTAFAQNQTVVKSDSTATEFGTEETEQTKIKRIIFRLNKPGHVTLLLKNRQSEIVATIIDDYYQNLGTQVKYLPVARLPQGKYTVELTVNDTKITQQFAVE
ncbi:3-coathanger stack domain-containing protein [Runella slithyformis]|uniref:3-coathanger stack domain-containing protein n=1 Tax=Runella slithyformis TaxID=106 RepID=UPI0002EAF91F|nr:3-coathanger stack domain-containing protein [Runella slithyformis]